MFRVCLRPHQYTLFVPAVGGKIRTSRRRGWPRGYGTLNSSSHSYIFTSVSVGSRPRSNLSTSAMGRVGVYNVPNNSTKSVRYVTLHFRDRRCAVSLRHRNHAATTVLVCKQKPYPVCGAKAIRNKVNNALMSFPVFY